MPFAAYHELVMELARLKREGFSAPSVSRETPPEPAELGVTIEAALVSLGLEPGTERQVRKTAWELRRAGLSDDEIADRITQGEPVDL